MGWTTRVTLVRHAQSQMNAEGTHLVGGRSNLTPLTMSGARASLEVGKRLGTAMPPPDLVVHTSARRSYQTARLICAGARWEAPMVIEDGLIELSQGAAEGQPREEWWTGAVLAAMRADPLRHRLAADGENHAEVQDRMLEAVARLGVGHPGGHVLAVSHGIAMRSLAWRLLGGGHATFHGLEVPNLAMLDFSVTHEGVVSLVLDG